jgi:hypothetical protein
MCKKTHLQWIFLVPIWLFGYWDRNEQGRHEDPAKKKIFVKTRHF